MKLVQFLVHWSQFCRHLLFALQIRVKMPWMEEQFMWFTYQITIYRSKSTSEEVAGGGVPGKLVPSEAVSRKPYPWVVNWLKRIRQKSSQRSKLEQLLLVKVNIRVALSTTSFGRLGSKERKLQMEPTPMSLSSLWSRLKRGDLGYASLGYSSTISQYVRSRW